MSEEQDDLYSAKWFRALVVAALLSGAGGGIGSLSKDTSDRFKGADFRREIATRDAEILRLRRELEAHLRHSARYTEKIITDDKRLDELERKFERHTDREGH